MDVYPLETARLTSHESIVGAQMANEAILREFIRFAGGLVPENRKKELFEIMKNSILGEVASIRQRDGLPAEEIRRSANMTVASVFDPLITSLEEPSERGSPS